MGTSRLVQLSGDELRRPINGHEEVELALLAAVRKYVDAFNQGPSTRIRISAARDNRAQAGRLDVRTRMASRWRPSQLIVLAHLLSLTLDLLGLFLVHPGDFVSGVAERMQYLIQFGVDRLRVAMLCALYHQRHKPGG